jgi:hypothetical protein
MKKLTLLAVIFATPAFSQDLTHPLEMDLPESSYTRPDPAEYQLVLENGLVAFVAEADQVPLATLSAHSFAPERRVIKVRALQSLCRTR